MRHIRHAPPLLAALFAAALLYPSTGAGQGDDREDTPPPDAPPAEDGETPVEPTGEEPPDEEPVELPPLSPLFTPGQPSEPFQEIPAGVASLSAQSCNACHGSVHDAWAESGHGRAWSSPLYQRALEAAGEPSYCLRCHLPLHNQRSQTVTGYDEATLAKPRLETNERFDPTLQGEGVTCAACHVREGELLGSRTLRPGEAPHVVRSHRGLADPSLCAACHQLTWPGTEEKPLYDTYREWQGSAWAAAGMGCQDCHMPLTVGELTGTRLVAAPSHRVVGSSDDRMLARALTVELGATPPTLQRGTELRLPIRILNSGAGHHVPTGNPHAWIEVRARVEGVDGLDEAAQSWPLRRVVDLEGEHAEGEDTRVPSGGAATFEYTVTPGKKVEAPATMTVVVELLYHRLPAELVTQYELADDEVSRVFHRQTIRIPLR